MTDYLTKAIEATASAVQNITDKDDYHIDGILYCGKCHTPKETIVNGKKRSCICDCEEKQRDQENEYREMQQRQNRIDRLMSIAYTDQRTKECSFADDLYPDSKLSKVAHRFVEHYQEMRSEGKGLLLYGSPGTGKSFYASCIVHELIMQGVTCLFSSPRAIIDKLTKNDETIGDFLDRVNQADLLVLDDFGAERDTEYMNEKVFDVIDSRYRTGKPTIITTNLNADELKNPQSTDKERIYSRIFEMCEPILAEGKDQRKVMLKNDDHIRKLLCV